MQRYLGPAPVGIDAYYAWRLRGGRGEGITFVDIEQGWLLGHEDLPRAQFQNGRLVEASVNHGTAVLGEIVAVDNGRGMTGIASRARFGVVSALRPGNEDDLFSVADAISVATQRLQAGDIILIEQHAKGPGDESGCNCNCGQYRFVPMEYWPAEFDAIKAATAKGIVVVEAGANGGQDLDDPIYVGAFDRNLRDSGAIMVGASNPSDQSAACFSSYGQRLDVHAWGAQVASTGYGDLDPSQQDPRRRYTKVFGGTSSASPIVTGAIAIIQGVRKANGLRPLTPREMRELLTSTGSPASGRKQIGPLPDLRKALAATLGPRLSSAALAR
jgi:subtilisin family serine protease